MRISDWSSDVCSSDLVGHGRRAGDAGGFDAAEAAGAALRHLWHNRLRRAAVPRAADRHRGERRTALDRQRRLPAPPSGFLKPFLAVLLGWVLLPRLQAPKRLV